MNGKRLLVVAAFAGLSAGQGRVNFDDNFPTVLGATASSVSRDETDTGYKLFVGHRFSI